MITSENEVLETGFKEVDYLVIGQGLAGTFISYYLLQAGKKVLVIDADRGLTATKAASGIINPVTGRRIVRTWRIEELLPFAMEAYTEMGLLINEKLVQECSVLDFHPTLQMMEAFEKQLPEEQEYLHTANGEGWQNQFNFHFGVGKISPCLLVDLATMLKGWRQYLKQQNALHETNFSWSDCKVSEENVVYKNIIASKIICCEGAVGVTNPYFKNLPYALNKGEVVIAAIDGLSRKHIYKQGLSIVPWQNNLFWIGSSYEWNFMDDQPTKAFADKVTQQLQYWLKLPFTLVDHFAAIRPANMERRPFVGVHPKHTSVAILNGLGTKGCSLAPFYAKQLCRFLLHNEVIHADADVKRFTRVLEREMN